MPGYPKRQFPEHFQSACSAARQDGARPQAGRLVFVRWSQGRHHPIISVDMRPQCSAAGSIVAESCAGLLGRVLGLVRSEASNKIIVQGRQRPRRTILCKHLNRLSLQAPPHWRGDAQPLSLWCASALLRLTDRACFSVCSPICAMSPAADFGPAFTGFASLKHSYFQTQSGEPLPLLLAPAGLVGRF